MSCEGHRAKYFDHLAGNLDGGNAQHLEKLYQAACNQPDRAQAELAELKTRLLFGDMQNLGIKPPTHAANGLPKKKSQHGYAAIYDHLKHQGYFEKRKNGKAPRPSKSVKAKVDQELVEINSEKAPKDETRKDEHPASEIPPERLAAITQQAQKGLSFVGLTEEDTAEQVERFPVWQYLPRCGKCGRWMSTQNPVCQNPKCGLAGQQQGEPIPWPPPGANFKHSRLRAQPSAVSADSPAPLPPAFSPLTRHNQAPHQESSKALPGELQLTNLPHGGLQVARGEALPVEIRREANGRFVALHQPDPTQPAQRSQEAETPEELLAWAKNTLNIHALVQPQTETDQAEVRVSQDETPLTTEDLSMEKGADQPPLQPHEVLLATPTGLKRVEITGITGNEVDYEEILPGRIPIRGAGTAKKTQVQAWGNPAMADLTDYLVGVTPIPIAQETEEVPKLEHPYPETAGAFGRCEKCGAFLDKHGQCNNPQCQADPGEAEETPELDPEGDEDLEEAFFEEIALAGPQGHDYHISDTDALGKGGAKTKARANLEAIKLIKQLETEGRNATPEEQAVLVKFVGWGGLPGVFDRRNEWYNPNSSYGMYRDKPEFYEEYKELKELLTSEEWNAASRSTVNAHYTSATVVKGVWEALKHMGYDQTNGTVLEPASGIGHFFGLMPEEFKGSNKVAVELDPFTARIAKQLYQNADVRNSGFEQGKRILMAQLDHACQNLKQVVFVPGRQ